ncbi:hypothetical protein D3C86_1814440 [compost metagenome]
MFCFGAWWVVCLSRGDEALSSYSLLSAAVCREPQRIREYPSVNSLAAFNLLLGDQYGVYLGFASSTRYPANWRLCPVSFAVV